VIKKIEIGDLLVNKEKDSIMYYSTPFIYLGKSTKRVSGNPNKKAIRVYSITSNDFFDKEDRDWYTSFESYEGSIRW
jgi:hypothetical protein